MVAWASSTKPDISILIAAWHSRSCLPLWVPQIVMSAGTVLLAVALIDQFLRVLLSEHAGVEQPDIADHKS